LIKGALKCISCKKYACISAIHNLEYYRSIELTCTSIHLFIHPVYNYGALLCSCTCTVWGKEERKKQIKKITDTRQLSSGIYHQREFDRFGCTHIDDP
jgi:hypothetical protein